VGVGGPPADAVGKGVTTDTISVGIGWIDLTALDSGAASIGCQNCAKDRGRGRDHAQAVVDYVNAQGGIAGRRVEPVYHQVPTTDLLAGTQTRRRAEEAMCADFTQDHEVFAMIPAVSMEGVMVECAKRSDTPMVVYGNLDWSLDETSFAEYGRWWYRPNGLVGERREKTMVERLVAQGFFGDDVKVGIMVEDKPQYTRGVDRDLKPALEDAGVDVATVIAYPDEVQSPWENYVLQMRSAGVTHVVWAHCACGGASAGLTMRAAENQGWRPRYALGTDTFLQGISALGPPEAQLRGIGGIGWVPQFDLPADRNAHAKEPAYSSGDEACRAIVQKLGDAAANGYCEALFFLKFALERSAEFSSGAMASAIERSGDSYPSVTTPAAWYGPGRHDGAAAVYDIAYDATCACFVYTGGPHPAAR
jgi:hypothetical protein